jgi:predicted enzyme related to lactoylglutathione lyase
MAQKTEYAPGTPNWIDIGVGDIPKAEAFYGGLLGWTAEGAGEDAGGYKLWRYNDKVTGGLGPAQSPGPPFWTTYFATDDIAVTTKAVVDAGGRVLVEPMDVMTQGRMAVYMDPSGAAFSAWQKVDFAGVELVNETNTWCWNELNTRDMDAAKAFYPKVFGWDLGGAPEYVEFKVGGDTVGGIMPMPEMVPAQVPNFWLVYFAVDDAAAASKRITELGGTVMAGPVDVEVGRLYVALDDQGATFAVITMKS